MDGDALAGLIGLAIMVDVAGKVMNKNKLSLPKSKPFKSNEKMKW